MRWKRAQHATKNQDCTWALASSVWREEAACLKVKVWREFILKGLECHAKEFGF